MLIFSNIILGFLGLFDLRSAALLSESKLLLSEAIDEVFLVLLDCLSRGSDVLWSVPARVSEKV